MTQSNDDEQRALVTMTRRELEQLIDERVEKALHDLARGMLFRGTPPHGQGSAPMEIKAYEQH